MAALKVYEPRRVYVVLDAETKRYVAGGTNLKNLREDFPEGEGYVIRTFVAESSVRAGGRS